MIVYQPYRPLTEYCADLNDEQVLPLAWRIVNDSLRTDASLLYPPYLIALGVYCFLKLRSLTENDLDY